MIYIPITLVLIIIAGIACIAIASRWPSQPAKSLFICAVAMLLVALPGVSILAFVMALFRFISVFGFVFQLWILAALSIIGAILMVLFAANAKFTIVDSPISQKPVYHGPVWTTNLTKKERVEASSKRNLAFLIDASPLMCAIISGFYAFALNSNLGRGQAAPIAATVFAIAFFVLGPSSLIYTVCKDAMNGQSFGKWLLSCRVVKQSTGQPAMLAESAFRNFLLLIPFMAFVELIVSMARSDRRRVGDLIADTVVVSGPPNLIDGVPVVASTAKETHPLDD